MVKGDIYFVCDTFYVGYLINCQTPYRSLVVKGDRHFVCDTRYFEFNNSKTESIRERYFNLIILDSYTNNIEKEGYFSENLSSILNL